MLYSSTMLMLLLPSVKDDASAAINVQVRTNKGGSGQFYCKYRGVLEQRAACQR